MKKLVQTSLECAVRDSSMILLYYNLAQNDALVTPLCMQLHFAEERGKYHWDESVLPVTKK